MPGSPLLRGSTVFDRSTCGFLTRFIGTLRLDLLVRFPILRWRAWPERVVIAKDRTSRARFGAWPGFQSLRDVNRRSWVDDPEGQINARGERAGGFWELMFPVMLCGAAHEEEAAVC